MLLRKPVGVPGFRVTAMARRDRQDRVYFLWAREKGPSGSKGGYIKVASEIRWPLCQDEQDETLVRIRGRAKSLSEARARGASAETLRQIAMPTVLAPSAVEAPLPVEQAIPTTPSGPTIRDVMAMAIGPSPRDLLARLRLYDATTRARKEQERREREAGKTEKKEQTQPSKRALGLPQSTQLSTDKPEEPTRTKTTGLSAKSCAALRQFWHENPPSITGIYRMWTQQAKTARSLADRIEDALGAERAFFTLTPNDQKRLFTPGVRDNAMKRVSTLLRVSRWAEREYGVSHGYRAPLSFSPTWQQNIWELTRGDDESPRRPRYDVPEAGRLWRVLLDAASPINPIIRLATLVGGEVRLGQVLNLRVKDCRQVLGAWMFKPPQSGKKATPWIFVPLALQREFGEAVAVATRRPDQRVFPISRRNAITAWKKVEALAAVPTVGWYALRRAMTDICPDARNELTVALQGSDDPLKHNHEVLLHVISGHIPRDIKDSIYRDLPVGKVDPPKPGTIAYEVMISAMRIVQHARRMAIARADSPV